MIAHACGEARLPRHVGSGYRVLRPLKRFDNYPTLNNEALALLYASRIVRYAGGVALTGPMVELRLHRLKSGFMGIAWT